ncbi:hypothetical protein Glove_132g74 [Diversispora epigaea]|uniref:Uncharacterized protein n=1 Tax=Diversispora epigaea TaxID=1348612 RepID=A0A397J1G9_9GLOM|nr:hypothetical protein Glove_132g74 [Diversispora epigaea]
MANIQSKVDSLEEQVSKLVAENYKLRKENVEINELKRKNVEFLAREAGLIARIAELEQSAFSFVEDAKLRDDELNELRSRVSKLERKKSQNGLRDKDTIVSEETSISKSYDDTNQFPVNDISSETENSNSNDVSSEVISRSEDTPASNISENISNPDVSGNFSSQPVVSSSEDKVIDEFLDSMHKETQISSSIKDPNCDNSEITRDLETQDIICLYQNACDAEKYAIEANQNEISCWCFYAKRFKSVVRDFMVNDEIGEKKAKGRVYDFIINQAPGIKRGNLYEKTLPVTEVSTVATPSILLSHISNSEDKVTEEVSRNEDAITLRVAPKGPASESLPEIEVSISAEPISKESESVNVFDADNGNDDEFSNGNEEDDDGSFCGFSDDDDEGYYYDSNTGKTYTKSERSICVF